MKLESESPLRDLLAAAGAVLVVGYLDFRTGIELRLYPLYFLPVCWAAWRMGRASGLAIALFSAVVWEVSNWLAGQTYSHLWIGVWNFVVQASAFATVCLLMWRLRVEAQREHQRGGLDALTGLYNNREFDALGAREIERARLHGQPVAMAFVDLDDFKAVNDSLGHQAGDEVLARVAGTLRAQTRKSDILARVGGDEFVALLPEAGPEVARTRAESIRLAIREEPARGGRGVTASIGVAAFLVAPESLGTLRRLADEAMYRAKARGKDGVAVTVVD